MVKQWRGNYFWTGGGGQKRERQKERVFFKFGPRFLYQKTVFSKKRSLPNFDCGLAQEIVPGGRGAQVAQGGPKYFQGARVSPPTSRAYVVKSRPNMNKMAIIMRCMSNKGPAR